MAGWSYEGPSDWPRRRLRVLRTHNHICHRCRHPGATAVDHVIPVSQGGTHDYANLRPIHDLCPTCNRSCHSEKTLGEIAAGRAKNSRRRPPPAHPGVI